VLSDAFATAYHAVWKGEVAPGDSVAIYGIGGVGIGAIQIAKIYGAAKVIAVDINDHKLKLAKELGADFTINSRREDPVAQIRKLTVGRDADVAFEMVGDKQVMEQTIQSVRLGGTAVIIGLGPVTIEVPPFSIIRGELEVKGSHRVIEELIFRD
jgi:threonine dehydrogenase-like Zn-dependent dehydrogenase